MEKKIEIIPAKQTSYFTKNWYSDVVLFDNLLARCFGNTKEEAESNARIAAKGYLVDELVDILEKAREQIYNYELNEMLKQKFSKYFSDKEALQKVQFIDELLTKAKM